jgi:hypothetical protein
VLEALYAATVDNDTRRRAVISRKNVGADAELEAHGLAGSWASLVHGPGGDGSTMP